MEPGSTVAGRFRIEARVGAGAMGEVFRAADLEAGRTVALKLLRANVPDGRARFAREIRALARLGHPGVVGHVAHGDGTAPFLAMEWLEGEDLRARLGRERLPAADVVRLGRELAAALAHVHARAMVHRDVKPANVFLEGGVPDHPKLVDFGLARLLDESESEDDFESSSGVLVGTPGYMAPEQARGQAGPAADVFGLGCVLYKCLTGRSPFQAPDMVATLARVLFDEPPPPSEHATGVPAALDALIARMLAKDPTDRPSANEVDSALRALDPRTTSARPSSLPRALTNRERKLVSVVLAYRGTDDDGEETLLGTKSGAAPEILDGVRGLSDRFGAHVEFLGLSILAVFTERGGAAEQSARAARFGLELVRLLHDVPIAIATGRAEVAQRIVGDAVESAIALARGSVAGRLTSDAITVGLLGADFGIESDGGSLLIARELGRSEVSPRTLLGKPTPCVGRDRELAELDELATETFRERQATAALFVAPSGAGKSRLRFEWLSRLRARGDVRIVTARCDAMTGSAPFALAGQWIREAAAVGPADVGEHARTRIAARVAAIATPDDVPRLTDFLAEIAGANPKDGASLQLSAARDDPMLMSDQVRAAFTDWLRGETESGPLVCVVDDLQWADAASIRLVDAALMALDDAPLVVFALARPELRAAFPTLWEGRRVHERRLPELPAGAAIDLARAVLGQATSASAISDLVRRAAGNAFFLEEMLRAHAEGHQGDVPETVQAVVQRRLESFDEPSRRALRAAAIFGMSFWTGAVDTLLGTGTNSGQALRELRDREVLTRRATTRFEGEEEWVFRHAYVREAAYAMSTDDDRVVGHRLAGEWLEAHAERDSLLIADHFHRGLRPTKTIPHLRRAAKQALDGNDLDLVVKIVEQGRAAGAAGEALGELCRYAAEALRWRARLEAAEEYARLAVSALAPSTPTWYAAVAELATAATVQGHVEHLLEAESLLGADRAPEAFVTARVVALSRVAGQLVVAGRPELAERMIALAEAADTTGSARARARLAQARGFRALHASDPVSYRRWVAEAQTLFDAIGDRRNACVQATNLGTALLGLGRAADAIAAFLPARASAVALGLARIVALIDQNLARGYLAAGDVASGIAVQTTAAEFFASQGDRRLEAYSRIYLTSALEADGRADDALAEARRAVEVAAPLPPALAGARATLADLLLRHRKGSLDEAEQLALPAHETLESLGGLEECEALVRLVRIEVHLARGEREAANRELSRALERLAELLRTIDDPAWKESFLEAIVEHRRLLALAKDAALPLSDAFPLGWRDRLS